MESIPRGIDPLYKFSVVFDRAIVLNSLGNCKLAKKNYAELIYA